MCLSVRLIVKWCGAQGKGSVGQWYEHWASMGQEKVNE